ncbi:peptide ABC transporter substrate-binding protein, partial [Raoultella ornithinolytica]
VMIAIAFSCEPDLLIADEPTTALDVTVQRQVLRLLKQKALATGTAVLFISHDMAVGSQNCDRLYGMEGGAGVGRGITKQVPQQPLHPHSVG